MFTKPLVVGLVAAGSITAAAGGAYLAVRQNATGQAAAEPSAPPLSAAASPTGSAPVTETEAVVSPSSPDLVEPVQETRPPTAPTRPTRAEVSPAPRSSQRAGRRPSTDEATSVRREAGSSAIEPPSAVREPRVVPPDTAVPVAPARPAPLPAEIVSVPPPPAEQELVQVIVPASSVIGLQVETSVSSERARVEDRVDARVTRDVTAEGRVAIPTGSRVIGSVTLVERGGKIKERARLGVRFHTLVFADGTEVPIRAEPIYREGESPSGESARKIGGAAVGGAILGAILGGGKGAVLGGAAGAAGGTAATMAGGRNAATLPAGTTVTVRLTEPVALDLEKR